MPKGGVRKGSGRKPKPLLQKIIENMPKREREKLSPRLLRLIEPPKPASPLKIPDDLHLELPQYKGIIPSPIEFYKKIAQPLHKNGHTKFVPSHMLRYLTFIDYYSEIMHYEIAHYKPEPSDEPRSSLPILYIDTLNKLVSERIRLWDSIQNTIEFYTKEPVANWHETDADEGDGWDEYYEWKRKNPWLDEH